MDFPFDSSGRCPACGDPTDSESSLCDACADMVRNDLRPFQPSGAEEYIAREEQKHVELMWSGRNVVTGGDLDFLADMKIVYGGCCGLELNAYPKEPRTCMYCGKPADDLGYCENTRRYMECEPKTRPGNPCIYCGETSTHYTLYVCANQCKFGACFPQTAQDREWEDRAFLNSCGISDVARGVVYVEIEMSGAVVRKARELHAMRNRKSLMGERRAASCGELDLGEIR